MLFEKVKKLCTNFVVAFKRKNIALSGEKTGAVKRFGLLGSAAVKRGQCVFITRCMCPKDLIV